MVAYYSIAEKLYQAMQQIYQPLVQALYPYIAKTKNMNIYKKVFITSVMFNILLTLILFGFDPILFPLVFSGATAEISKNIFHILLVSIIFVVPSLLLGYPLLGALGYAKQANRSVVFGSISHLFFLMILILFDFINVYSVAWLVAYTEFFVFCYRLISAKKFILKSSISRQ